MATSRTLADPPLHTHRHQCVLATAMLLVAMLFLPLTAAAQAQMTMTSLTVQPANQMANQPVTLTASVCATISGCPPVTVGTVTFLSGTQVLGTVQVVGTDMSGFTPGTATLKLQFAPGTYSLTAQYNANTSYQGSSGSQPLTVTGTEPTTTTVTATPDGSNYDFSAVVFGYGLAAPNPTTGTVSLTEVSSGMNLGNITLAGPAFAFSPATLISLPVGSSPYAVAVGDFEGMGHADLAVVNNGNDDNGTVSILIGDGTGSFQSLQTVMGISGCGLGASIAVGDLNEDGIPDLAIGCTSSSNNSGTIYVVFGQAGGMFGTPMSYSGYDGISGVAIGDFNGDGSPDIAASVETGSVLVLQNDGTGNFSQHQFTSPAGMLPGGIAVADFNGDGKLDVAVPDFTANMVNVLIGLGNGMFDAPVTYPAGHSPNSIATADFNGDGCPDLAVTNTVDHTVGVFVGNKNMMTGACMGTFAAQSTYPTGTSLDAIAVADFNGDGCPDLAVPEQANSSVGVLIANKDMKTGACLGTFQVPPLTNPAGIAPHGVAIGDFNGDGVPDLAVTNVVSTTTTLILNGTATSGTRTNVFVPGTGQQQINASYTPNTNFYSDSDEIVLVNGSGLLPTTTMLTSSQNPSPPNQPVTFTAAVTATGGGMPTGTVTFTSDGGPISECPNPVNLVNGQATCTTSTLPLGTHMIVAMYSGDSTFAPSSGQLSQQVLQIATTTTVSSSLSPSYQNQPVTFTAMVTATGGGMPTGTVTFTSDGGPISECPNPVNLVGRQATCTTSTLPLGTHTIVGMYSGDSNFAPSSGQTSQQVLAQNGTSTTLAISPTMASPGQVVTLTATVSSSLGPVTLGTVTFLSGTQVLGTVQVVGIDMSGFTPGTATLKLGFAPGTYSLTAQYNANYQFGAGQSGPQQLTVTGTEPTATTLTATPAGSNWDFMVSVFGYGLAVPDPTTGTVSLTEVSTGFNLGNVGLAGPGMSGFLSKPTFPVDSPYGVAKADLNGDGIPDLAMADSGDNAVVVLLGNGDGTFQPGSGYGAGNTPYGVAIWDFNGDGIPDIVVVNNSCNVSVGTPCGFSGTVSVLLGNPAHPGTFQPQVTYPLGPASSPQYSSQYVTIADFNGDGFADLAVTNKCGDDATCGGLGTVSVLLGNGDGTFESAQTYPVGSFPIGIATADFNGLNTLDLAVVNNSCQVSAGMPCPGSGTVGVLIGNGDGTFQPQVAFTVENSPFGIVTADFNGDGLPDLAVTNQCGNDLTCHSPGTVSVLLNDSVSGQISFQTQVPYPVGNTPKGIAAADFNGDGCVDLAVTNFNDNTLGVLLGNVSSGHCNGTFPMMQTTYPTNPYPMGIAIADFNSDGVPDIAIGNLLDDTAGVLLGGTYETGGLPNVFVPGSGQQQVNANYTPNTNFYSSSVGSMLVQGSLVPTTSTLAVTANGQPIMSGSQVPPGTAIVLNTTVMPATYGTLQASGTVSFFDGNTLLAMVPITIVTMQGSTEGVASFSPNLVSGPHSLSASYSGDSNFGPSGSSVFQLTITAAGKQTPTLNLTVSPNPVNFGSNTYFTAMLQTTGGLTPTGTVTFAEGTTVLATEDVDTNGQAIYINNTLVLGQHTITATYNGDNNFNPASGTVKLQVNTPFTLTGNMNSGTVTPPQPATFTVTVDAAWQNPPLPLIYAVMTCSAPAGLTCSVACPTSPSNPSGLGNLCVLTGLNKPSSTMATVTVDTSGLARLNRPLRQREQRVMAAWVGFGGFGLAGLVFVPVKLRRKATATFLFLMMVVLCFGIGCTAFAPGSSSSPVNNTFNIKVTATLLEENSQSLTGYNKLGLQVFWYELLIK